MRLPVNRTVPLAAFVLLAACGGGSSRAEVATPFPANGPQADYPMVIGTPYVVDGVTWTPADLMNVDQVGHAAVGPEGGSAISGAHRTLPLPNYVEVTELNTGKTILVRLERRGPMNNSRLITLSPGAAAQLGITGDGIPVRVRRVNPPEVERALLRSGQSAPARMDTPKSLLTVLMRKLEGGKPALQQMPAEVAAPAPAPVSRPVAAASPVPAPRRPASEASLLPTTSAPAAAPAPAPAAAVRPATTAGSLVIQAGAFSSKERADASAAKIGGQVSRAGNVWRVRKGPYSTRAQAEAGLAQVRAAGYSDARIQSAN